MRYILFILLPLLSLSAAHSADNSSIDRKTALLLEKLDHIVSNKELYHTQRQAQINGLQKQAHRASGHVKANLYREIAALYSHYQTDSAQVYLDMLEALPETKRSAILQGYVHTGRAEICAVAGLYAEAIKELSRVDPSVISPHNKDLQLYYFRTQRTLYGWMADYTQLPQLHNLYAGKTMQYRDSLLAAEGSGLSRDIVLADKATALGHPQNAISILLPYTRQMHENNFNQYVSFTLYQAFGALGREKECLYYLALTAIADLQSATTEYQALPILAQQLFQKGDVERAYNYLLCSMEDASMCKASLRTVEVSKIFPIIDRQYKEIETRQHRNERMLTIALGGLLLLLSLTCIYLHKQMKRLHASRQRQEQTNRQLEDSYRQLEDTNRKLEDTNEKKQLTLQQLQLTDKVKEEYIARYLNRCRDYIDTLQGRQRLLYRLFKDKRMEDLGKELKSEAAIKEEQDKFYIDFDTAFLTLFPDFIPKINALLRPDAQLTPKHEGQLNTELRIFALIRLGITDTQRIAHFLNYSTATVYNYRSKIRNKAIGVPADFESRVEKL